MGHETDRPFTQEHHQRVPEGVPVGYGGAEFQGALSRDDRLRQRAQRLSARLVAIPDDSPEVEEIRQQLFDIEMEMNMLYDAYGGGGWDE